MSVATSSSGLGRRLASNALHAAGGRMASVLVWLLFAPMILHRLGGEAFGVWALFFALTGNFAALDVGLVQGTLRHVAAARERGDHGEAGAFATLGVLGLVALGVLWLAIMLAFQGPLLAWLRIPAALVPEARFAMVASAGVFVVSGLANVTIAIAQGYGRFDLANVTTLVLSAQHAIGIPVVLHNGWGLRGLVVNVALGWTLGGLVGLALLPRSAPGFRFRSPRAAGARAREAFAFGGPMQVTSVLSVANQHLDKFLLSRFVALAAVTPYELGSRVATAAIAFPQLLLLAVMPAAAALHGAADHARLRELYERGNRWVLAATAVTVAALIGAAGRLYGTWLGPGHDQAAWVLRALALAWGFAMAAGMASAVARGIGRTDLEAWFHVVSVSIHLALSLWLLPVIGLAGALLGFAAGHAAGAIVFMTALAGALGWPRARTLVAPNLVPFAATALGVLAGLGLDRLLPAAHRGMTGWIELASTAGAAAAVAVSVLLALRYVDVREARALLTPGAGAAAAVAR